MCIRDRRDILHDYLPADPQLSSQRGTGEGVLCKGEQFNDLCPSFVAVHSHHSFLLYDAADITFLTVV